MVWLLALGSGCEQNTAVPNNDGTAQVCDCDDGLSCTINTCVEGECITVPDGMCDWPAEHPDDAVSIIEDEDDNEFGRDLSGAVWNPVSRELWVVRNNGPSKVWALSEGGPLGYEITNKGGKRSRAAGFYVGAAREYR